MLECDDWLNILIVVTLIWVILNLKIFIFVFLNLNVVVLSILMLRLILAITIQLKQRHLKHARSLSTIWVISVITMDIIVIVLINSYIPILIDITSAEKTDRLWILHGLFASTHHLLRFLLLLLLKWGIKLLLLVMLLLLLLLSLLLLLLNLFSLGIAKYHETVT